MHFTVAAIGENHSNYKFGLGFVLNTKKLNLSQGQKKPFHLGKNISRSVIHPRAARIRL